jgi:hypothetical protein
MRFSLIAPAAAAALVSSALCSFGQIASDSAQNYPMTVGSGVWNAGDNNGFGFQPWQFVVSGSGGLFLGDSTQNGGDGQGNGGSSGGINSPNIRAFGAFGNNGGSADAVRPFAAGLDVGETFSVDFDNGFIQNGGSEGIRLADNSSGMTLWEFVFTGGQSVYQVFDSRGFADTTVPFTDNGMHIDFTLTGSTSYSVTIRQADGTTRTVLGDLANPGSVSQFSFFDHNGGFNSSNNVYANNLVVVPEPSLPLLILLGGFIALMWERPRSRKLK